MDPFEFLGNLLLLIVGGNDTTRNSISGGVLALNQFPEEYDKLRADRSLIPNMVAEIIRWQTPLAHMRRRALVDTELGGQQIKAGDKVVMWYVSGNRDDSVFEDPNRLIIDRKNARQHLSGWLRPSSPWCVSPRCGPARRWKPSCAATASQRPAPLS